MIQKIKEVLEAHALKNKASFSCLDIDELEKYVHDNPVNKENPLINLVPIESFSSNIGESTTVDYDIPVRLYFLSNFTKENDIEAVKDIALESMVELSGAFLRGLSLSTDAMYFTNEEWVFDSTFIRSVTSHLLLGVQSDITLKTSCNRI